MSAGAPPPLRLLVADDQPIIRRGLALMLGAEDDIEVVGQAADGQQALELAHALHPDVVVMDLHMPRVGGVAATRLLSAQLPRVAVVVLTTFDDDELVFEAVRAGARAYLLKDAAEAEVLEQFRALAAGWHGAAPAAAPSDPRPLPASDPLEEPLTDKEERILALLADGCSNKQIADQVFLAEGTVKNYVSRIMDKLHARNRTELAVKAAGRHG